MILRFYAWENPEPFDDMVGTIIAIGTELAIKEDTLPLGESDCSDAEYEEYEKQRSLFRNLVDHLGDDGALCEDYLGHCPCSPEEAIEFIQSNSSFILDKRIKDVGWG